MSTSTPTRKDLARVHTLEYPPGTYDTQHDQYAHSDKEDDDLAYGDDASHAEWTPRSQSEEYAHSDGDDSASYKSLSSLPDEVDDEEVERLECEKSACEKLECEKLECEILKLAKQLRPNRKRLDVDISETRNIRVREDKDTYEQGEDGESEYTAELVSRKGVGNRLVVLRSAGARSEVEACEWLLEVLKELIKAPMQQAPETKVVSPVAERVGDAQEVGKGAADA